MTQINQIRENLSGAASKMAPLTILFACSTLGSGTLFAQQWNAISPMFQSVLNQSVFNGSAATGPDGKVYVVGGSSSFGGASSKTVNRYNPSLPGWESVKNMNSDRAYHATVTGCDGQIYAIGGESGSGPHPPPIASVESYDTVTGQWTVRPSLSQARTHLVAAVGPNCAIYAFDTQSNPVVFEVFDGTTWTAGSISNSTRSISSAVSTHDGHIFAVGVGAAVYEFDGIKWIDRGYSGNSLDFTGANNPGFAATLGVDGRIFVVGGSDDEAVTPAPATLNYVDLWQVAPLKYPHSYGMAATAEGSVFLLGPDYWATEAYGPQQAVLGPYKFWKNFDGPSGPVGPWYANCSLTGYSIYYNRVAGRVGNWAGNFDGTGNHNLSAPASCTAADFDAGDFSIEFWMKHDGTGVQTTQSILDKRYYDASGYHGYHVYFSWGAVGLQMANEKGAYANYTSSIPIPKNQWTHVAITVSRTPNAGKIWLNGVLARTFQPIAGTLTSTAPLNIGGHNFGGPSFKGQLDELTEYSRALTFPEVRSVFLAGAQGKK